MNKRWHPQLAARIRRVLVVTVALIGYLAGAVGFPVPVTVVKDTNKPFPCQNHSCGCQTAEQCWQHCCCYTTEEKVAWARANHVEPPPAVVDAKGWTTPRLRDQQEKPTTKATRDCCTHRCCSTDKPLTEPKAEAPKKSSSWVVGLSARNCRGQGNHWLGGAASFPPPRPVNWAYEWVPLDWLLLGDDEFVSFTSPPVLSPPRG